MRVVCRLLQQVVQNVSDGALVWGALDVSQQVILDRLGEYTAAAVHLEYPVHQGQR